MKLQERAMRGLADFVFRFRVVIAIVGLVLLFLSFAGANLIETKTEIKDMLPENSPQVQMFERIREDFYGGSQLMITVEGTNHARMDACVEKFVQKMMSDTNTSRFVKAVQLKLDRDFVNQWGFMFQKAEDLERSRETFSQLNLLPFVTALNDNFERVYTGDEAEEDLETHRQEADAVAMLGQMETFFVALRDYLADPGQTTPQAQAKELAETFLYGDAYAYSPDHTMIMFTVTPNFQLEELDNLKAFMPGIRAIRDELSAEFPDLLIGYTGDVGVNGDEMDAMGFDMMVPALVAMFVILILFIFSFEQIRGVVFMLITLVFGIIYTYGLIGVTIREITTVTSSLGVILVGLGIDYGIQIVANFNGFRTEGFSPQDAIPLTFEKAGMGNILAALTTAVAFFVMSFTGTKMFTQFGVVAGIGILCCLFAMLFVLPSLLLMFGKKDFSRPRIPKIDYGFVSRIAVGVNKNKKTTLIIGGIVTLALIGMIFFNKFEYDFMKLEPQNVVSIKTYKKVIEKFDMNPFTSAVVAEDVEEARQLTEKLEKVYSVSEINSISYLIPSPEEQEARLREIRKFRTMPPRYRDMKYAAAQMAELSNQLQRLEYNIIELGDLSVAGLGENNKIMKKRNSMIREILGAETGKPGEEVFQKLIQLISSNPALYGERLSQLDYYFSREMDNVIRQMSRVDKKLTIKDLPEEYIAGIMHKNGKRNLVVIYPTKDATVDGKAMIRFCDQLKTVSPKITGMLPLSMDLVREMIQSSKLAAIIILVVVLVFVLLMFRNLKHSLLAMIPLLVGGVWMFGLMPILGVRLNFMNLVLLPMVIGMGIDYGIHFSHRNMVDHEIGHVYGYTGKAVLLSALTTMIGFGSLALIGTFKSIASIGEVLFIGIMCCMLAAILILPVFLEKNNKAKGGQNVG